MKKLLPIIIVAVMAGLSSWGYAQWGRCLPGVWSFRYATGGTGLPMPHSHHQPMMPSYHYPPGVAPEMTIWPLPTSDPSFDVDISSFRSRPQQEFVLSQPTSLPKPQNLLPIPAFSPGSQVASGRFDSFPRKRDTDVNPPQDNSQPVIAPETSMEQQDNVLVESEPFDTEIDEEIKPEAVETPFAEEISMEDRVPLSQRRRS